MSDKFLPKFNHSVEVIWSEDLSGPLVFMVNGHRIAPGNLGNLGNPDYRSAIANMELLDDLFVVTTLLRAKILSRHCH
jgi:hypothetical protein